jgi:hypothetical protein
VCDFSSGVRVRNFFESVGTRLLLLVTMPYHYVNNLHLASSALLDGQVMLEHLGHQLESGDLDQMVHCVMLVGSLMM